ncbi:MAG: 16S rRNA (guanine(527)-N(7))-methyltransferase RsmG [Prevotella sp.]|nr:16S rRNA (guanine(527)-N(7))-methyltransferase RsmG [Prevotella sp.]
MKEVFRYFPSLAPGAAERLSRLPELYSDRNAKINVVSRKDINNLCVHHVLHSLAIAKAFRFLPGTSVLDVGTGGGFPGIPLAIVCPDCSFTLIDGTAKKVRVAGEIARELGLTNVTARRIRVEEERGEYDFAVSRAVMPLPDLYRAARKNISKTNKNAQANGLIVLKGGDISDEIKPFSRVAETIKIRSLFPEEAWFDEKYIIYVPC